MSYDNNIKFGKYSLKVLIGEIKLKIFVISFINCLILIRLLLLITMKFRNSYIFIKKAGNVLNNCFTLHVNP